jgi:hypothetical protein
LIATISNIATRGRRDSCHRTWLGEQIKLDRLAAPQRDPIFAAIERYEKTNLASCDALNAREIAEGKAKRRKPCGNLPALIEAERAADEQFSDATDQLFGTEPTTIAGAVALLQWLIEDSGGSIDERAQQGFESVAAGLEKLKRVA